MIRHQDGTITELPQVRPPTMPKNAKQEDTLLNMTTMSNDDRERLVKVLEHQIEKYEE